MLTFYLIAGGTGVLVALLLVRPLIAGRGAAESRDAHDAQVFRDQLAEIERDLARGTISPGEAEGARLEVSRRLIGAAERARRGEALRPAPQGHSGLVAGLALIGTPALAVAVYLGLGAPGVPDQPLASRPEALAALGGTGIRPGQEDAEAAMTGQGPPAGASDPRYAATVAQLQTALAERPDDIRGRALLANALMNLGRYAEAWREYGRVVALAGGTADADTHGAKAEGMILAAGGYVSPEAEAEIARALSLDPSLPIARYYGGLALRQAGRTDEAVAMWQALRRDSPPDAPYLPWLDMMLAEAGQGAPGAGTPGPTQNDIAAAEQLSPEERAAMIDGMVARLDERLARQGGTAEEWGRLIASYAALGRTDQAAGALRRALAVLDQPGVAAVRAQAAGLGLADAAGGLVPDTRRTASGPAAAGVLPAAGGSGATAAPGATGAPAASGRPSTADAGATPGTLATSDRTSTGGTVATPDRISTAGAVAIPDRTSTASTVATPDRTSTVGTVATPGATATPGGTAAAGATAVLGAIAPATPGALPPAVAGSAPAAGRAGNTLPGAGPASGSAGAGRGPSATLRGPTAADVAAAAQMAPQERAAMIEGMVARLGARLDADGGTAEEWLRLVDAQMKLGRPEEAARAYGRAAAALAGDPQAGFVREQALLMGVPIQ